MSSTEELTITRSKTLLTTSNPFEQTFGYHRAVRRGPFITTSGTTALKIGSTSSPPLNEAAATERVDDFNSKVHFPGNAYRQTIHVLEISLAAISRLGGKKEDVVRVRMFVGNGDDCGTVGDAFKTVFGVRHEDLGDGAGQNEDLIGTAATMIVVPGGFVDGEILVEIEMEAFIV